MGQKLSRLHKKKKTYSSRESPPVKEEEEEEEEEQGSEWSRCGGTSGGFSGCCLLGDGQVAATGFDGSVALYTKDGSQLLGKHHGSASGCVRLSNSAVASYGRDRTLRAWNSRGSSSVLFEGHDLPVSGACCIGGLLASGSRDNTVRIWDLPTGVQLRCSRLPRNVVTCVATRPSTQTFAQGSEDLRIRIWDARQCKPCVTFSESPSFALCLDAVDSYVLAGTKGFQRGQGCQLQLWDLRKPTEGPSTTANLHSQDVTGVAYLPSEEIVSCSKDGTLRLWSKDLGPKTTRSPHAQPIFTSLAAYNDSFAATTFQGALYVSPQSSPQEKNNNEKKTRRPGVQKNEENQEASFLDSLVRVLAPASEHHSLAQ